MEGLRHQGFGERTTKMSSGANDHRQRTGELSGGPGRKQEGSLGEKGGY